ncbi:GA-binding protein subunit beta-2 isoform X2 [Cephus cinctus]|uniref:GA-binding protein subunit beta-2 isoform X2 n=1 Tax=Cephus cinctus TaxID=211228 RepID=A0AAJ7RS05_CEPCN|nr:GA-binding protein subunit beta-2 isoform X2 [Cephus cinctus]
MQAESICAGDIEGLDGDTLIPVEILSCDVSHRSRSQDALSIVELGKQLLLSARNGDTETVRDLMCRGAPFTTDWLGTSALHLSAQNNHTETAEVLLRAGISRDARTKVDRTPLHMAAYEGHHQMAQLLLNYGADVDSRDMLKMTPLHWAVEREHVEVMNVLLEHGADANATSKFDKTPISLALEHDRLDLVDILQQEREILGVQTHQQSQANSAELEVATHSLMQLEAERQQEQQELELQQQQQLQKRKVATVQVGKKPRMVFQQIRVSSVSDEEHEKDIECVDGIENQGHGTSYRDEDVSGVGGADQPLRLLQAHGITMIPVDNDATIVENAMESGQTVVLTAGKLALNLTRTPSMGMKRLQVGTRRGTSRKVIAIRADQILGQNAPTLTPRGPNILKRNINENKAGKLFLASLANSTSTVPTLTQAKHIVSLSKNKVVNQLTKVTEQRILHLDDEIEEITEDDNQGEDNTEPVMDIAVLNRQLAEARRQAAEYRKQLQKKEEEAEKYKQQLKSITAQAASK